jgi:hypothetical protein
MLPNASTRLGVTCYTPRAMGRAKSTSTFRPSTLPLLEPERSVVQAQVVQAQVVQAQVVQAQAIQVQAASDAGGRVSKWRGLALLVAVSFAFGCESGGVGDPCIPEDEFFPEFSGFSLGEVNVESRSYQCETRVCLVNKFQGRVSCPYGTKGDDLTDTTVNHNYKCQLPELDGVVTAPVEPWRTERPPELAVYCSCRCAGDDPNARYCECPSGFECTEIVVNQGQGQAELAGSYCIRNGSNVDPVRVDTRECSVNAPNTTPGVNDLTCGNLPEAATNG